MTSWRQGWGEITILTTQFVKTTNFLFCPLSKLFSPPLLSLILLPTSKLHQPWMIIVPHLQRHPHHQNLTPWLPTPLTMCCSPLSPMTTLLRCPPKLTRSIVHLPSPSCHIGHLDPIEICVASPQWRNRGRPLFEFAFIGFVVSGWFGFWWCADLLVVVINQSILSF